MKIMSSFAHSHVFPNLYDFLSSLKHIENFLRMVFFLSIECKKNKKTFEVVKHYSKFIVADLTKQYYFSLSTLKCNV